MTGKVKPVYKKCGCGRRVTHHHILCDKCWKKKEKMSRPNKWSKDNLKEEIKKNNKKIEEGEQNEKTTSSGK